MNDDWTTDVDGMEEMLAGLPQSIPDAAHAARVRRRCHKELARPPLRRSLEAAVVGGFCAVYFLGVALIALHTHGLL